MEAQKLITRAIQVSDRQTKYSADSLRCCMYMWHQIWTGSVRSDDGICFNHITSRFHRTMTAIYPVTDETEDHIKM